MSPATRPGPIGPLLGWAIVYADVGSSVYYTAGILYDTPGIGTRAALFVVLVAVAGASLAAKYAEIAGRYPDGGGVVAVASDAFGPVAGCVGGLLVVTDYFLTAAIGVLAGVLYLGAAFDVRGAELPIAVLALLLLGLLNLLGLRRSAMVSLVLALAGFATQVLVVLVTVVQLGPEDWALLRRAAAATDGLGPRELLTGFGAGWLAFSGLESLGQISPALRAPRLRVARAVMVLVFGATVATAPLLTAFSAVLLRPVPGGPGSPHMIATLAGVYGGWPLRLACVGAATSLLVFSSNTAIVGGYHVMVSLARRRFLPARLAASGVGGTPARAIAVATIAPLAILLVAGGRIDALGALYAFGLLGAFVVASGALDWIRWREGRRGAPLVGGVLVTASVYLAWTANLAAKPAAALFGGGITLAGLVVALATRERWLSGPSPAGRLLHGALLRLGRLVNDAVDFYHRRFDDGRPTGGSS